MSSLLPPNATAFERALEATTSRISDVPVLVRESWDPDTCPVALLPWLAWTYSVDVWDSSWDTATQRAVIKGAYDRHRRKGTVGSIRRAFTDAGLGDIVIEEGRHRGTYDGTYIHDGWLTYGGGWAWYRVTIVDLITGNQAEQAMGLLEANAPYRSELYALIATGAE